MAIADEPEQQFRRPTYWGISNCETPERYEPGGYHPISLGDSLNNQRYTVVHKLGFGSYSTVWLVRDREKNKFAALKILTADAQVGAESRVLQHLRQEWDKQQLAGSGVEFPIPEVWDKFELEGPNGTHQCIVSEPLGPSLVNVTDHIWRERLPPPVGKRVAEKIAARVAALHRCGIVHGDLHPGNILFALPGMDAWTDKDVYSYFGEPDQAQIERRDDKSLDPDVPTHLIRPPPATELLPLCLTEDCNVKIVDFGEAFITREPISRELHTPIWYAAPEVLLKEPTGPAADVWSLACLIFRVLGRGAVFRSFDGERDDILVDIVRYFGKLPERLWKKWETRLQYFTEEGEGHEGDEPTTPLDFSAALKKQIAAAEDNRDANEVEEWARSYEPILRKMLRFEPEERITAEEAASLLGVISEERKNRG